MSAPEIGLLLFGAVIGATVVGIFALAGLRGMPKPPRKIKSKTGGIGDYWAN